MTYTMFINLIFVPFLIINCCHGDLVERVERLEEEERELIEMVTLLENSARKPDDAVMAFSVSLSQDAQVADSQRVPFDQINIDVGEGWRYESYEYDCPLDGYYAFSVAMRSPPVKRGARVCIVKNTDTSVRTCAKAYQRSTTVDTGTHMAYGVFTCEAQSSIYVMAYTNSTVDPNTFLLAGATFHGFLIN